MLPHTSCCTAHSNSKVRCLPVPHLTGQLLYAANALGFAAAFACCNDRRLQQPTIVSREQAFLNEAQGNSKTLEWHPFLPANVCVLLRRQLQAVPQQPRAAGSGRDAQWPAGSHCIQPRQPVGVHTEQPAGSQRCSGQAQLLRGRQCSPGTWGAAGADAWRWQRRARRQDTRASHWPPS